SRLISAVCEPLPPSWPGFSTTVSPPAGAGCVVAGAVGAGGVVRVRVGFGRGVGGGFGRVEVGGVDGAAADVLVRGADGLITVRSAVPAPRVAELHPPMVTAASKISSGRR